MSAKLDLTSAAEPHKMSGPSSAAPNTGQKLSIFSAKSGFVIPKNKLSGSLVPVFRGAKKHGVTGAINDESSKQIERKTKWGPDLTQDAAVKRAKAFALQIRVDQITKLLESEKLEVASPQNPDQSNPSHQIDSKKSEMLELEKREAVGEILKLDPSYKPPPGFKPLLKEATIPLPIQEYPGYNFIGLIYGPEGDNQKQLEQETGARIKVHGTKADTGEKGEIKPGSDIKCSYKEIHVNISADSFDKVDAAVSIIELLITSVTGNLAAGSIPSVSGDSTNVMSQSQDGPPSHLVSTALENQVVAQPITSTQMHGGHLQYLGPWFSAVPSHNLVFPSSGNIAPQNSSGLARTPLFPSQTMNPSNMASAFGAQPAAVTGFHPTIPNQHFSMQAPPPRQILQHSHMSQASPVAVVHIGPPRNHLISGKNFSAPTNASISFPVTLSQPTPIGQLQTSVSSMPPPMSGISPAPIPNQPSTPLGDTSGQNGTPITVKVSTDLSNMKPMALQAGPPTRPAAFPQPNVAFKPLQSNMSLTPRSAAFPPHQVGISPGLPLSLGPMPLPVPAPTHLSGPVSFPSSGVSPSLSLPQQSGIPNPASGVAPYHTHVMPPALTATNSGNFTFQSRRPNADSQVVSRPTSQATTQGGTQEPASAPGPWPPPFGFSAPDRPFQTFPRTQIPNQVDQTQAHVSAAPFGGRPGSVSIPPRHNAFPYAGQPAPRSPFPQMGMKNFISAPQMSNMPNPGVPRGQQNYPAQKTWPGIPMPLNQKVGNNPSVAFGKPAYPADQIYDPFSPTSIPPP